MNFRLQISDLRLTRTLVLGTWFLALVVMSCCGYSTRSLLPNYMKTVHVKLFENNTLKAGLDEVATNNVVDAVKSGSGLRLTNESSADIVIEGGVSGYSKDPYTYTSAQEVIEYKLTVKFTARCIDQVRNEIFWEGSVSDFVTYQSNEEQAIIDASKKTAEKLVNTILTNW